jgi:hypothetical protein
MIASAVISESNLQVLPSHGNIIAQVPTDNATERIK